MEEIYQKGNSRFGREGPSFSGNLRELELLAAQAHRAFTGRKHSAAEPGEEYLNEERLAEEALEYLNQYTSGK